MLTQSWAATAGQWSKESKDPFRTSLILHLFSWLSVAGRLFPW